MIAEKEILLSEVISRINPKNGFIVVKYQNLKGNSMADFRSSLHKTGSDFFVLKKRVFLKAARELNLDYEQKELEGHIGLVYTKDNFVAATKALYEYKNANADAVEVLGCHFEGRKCTPNDVEQISKLPSLIEMRAELLGLFEQILAAAPSLFEAVISSVIYCLDNKSKLGSEEA